MTLTFLYGTGQCATHSKRGSRVDDKEKDCLDGSVSSDWLLKYTST